MCYFSNKEYRKASKGSFSEKNMEDIARIFFPQALQVVLGCGAEPTINNNFMNLLELAALHKVPNISLVTNGLLLRNQQIDRMHQIGVNEIILSAHGLTKASYERFMINGQFDKFINLITKISDIKKEGSQIKLRINYTVNNDNLEDLLLFHNFIENYSIDAIQVRPIMDIGGKYSKEMSDESIKIYNSHISQLQITCKSNGVKLLANTSDVSYTETNKDSNIIESIYTYISPKTIVQFSLGDKINSLKAYKKEVNWYRNLFKGFIKRKKSDNKFHKHSMKYDIQ
ncbi:MAG: radical SAM protein [Bacteroidales bacterium]|nr:radical SAM protein [Bacteroidales bacterium]